MDKIVNISAAAHARDGEADHLDRRAFFGRVGRVGAAGLALRLGVVGGTGGLASLVGNPAFAAPKHTRASGYDAAVLHDWFATLYSATMDDRAMTPGRAARVYAHAAVAAYQSLLGGAPQLKTLAGQLTGLSRTPHSTSNAPTDWPAMASAAMAAAIAGLLRNGPQATLNAAAAQLAAHVDQRRAAGVDAKILDRSLARGREVGDHVAAWGRGDGAEATYSRAYTPPVGDALWKSTAPNFGTAIDPYWGSVRPMVLPNSSFCAPVPPIPFSKDEGSPFRQQVDAVMAAQLGLTDAGRRTAEFWRDNPVTSGLPSGHWVRLAAGVCQDDGLALDRTAEVLAVTAIALSDAFISCWQEKYTTNLLRPITYIHEVMNQPGWTSFVNTPQFPEYTSGHSVSSQAAATVLTAQLGTRGFTDRSHLLRNASFGVRSYSSFQTAANEAANSRILGGIHYPMGIERGLEQGERVGSTVVDRVRTR